MRSAGSLALCSAVPGDGSPPASLPVEADADKIGSIVDRTREVMVSVRVLGAAGLTAAALTTVAGLLNAPCLFVASGMVMFVANAFALFAPRKRR